MSSEDDEPLTRIYSPSLSLYPPRTSASIHDRPLAHFKSIEWTSELLSRPDVYTYIPHCRNPSFDGHDRFFSETLQNPRGLSHMLGFFVAPATQVRDPEAPIREISVLCQLGEGLGGIPGALHGGVTMSLVDEGMGQLIELNSALGKKGETYVASSVTATLETKFLNLIPAESVVMITAYLEGTERRKTRVRCEVTNEDGEVLAEAKSIWVSMKAHL